jgi:hypothetical protein
VRTVPPRSPWPKAIAATEDVITTRLTVPAAALASSTRTAPSTAGRIRSFSSFGTSAGNGEATCCT